MVSYHAMHEGVNGDGHSRKGVGDPTALAGTSQHRDESSVGWPPVAVGVREERALMMLSHTNDTRKAPRALSDGPTDGSEDGRHYHYQG